MTKQTDLEKEEKELRELQDEYRDKFGNDEKSILADKINKKLEKVLELRKQIKN